MIKLIPISHETLEKELKGLTKEWNREELSFSQLRELVEWVSIHYFGKEFKHDVIFNKRLKSTGGRYHLATYHLDFNPKVYKILGLDEFVKVIKHELCHYHLHIEGMGYRHRDSDFKVWLTHTRGSRFVPRMDLDIPKKEHRYLCQKCQQLFVRKRRVSVEKYRCPCGGRLKLIEERTG